MNSRRIALSFGFFAILAAPALTGCAHWSPSASPSASPPASQPASAPHPVVGFAVAGKAPERQAQQAQPAHPERFDANTNPILDARHGWSPASPR